MRIPTLVAVAVLVAACAAKSHPAPQTVLSGNAALSTFPTAPKSVRLLDETGKSFAATIATDGSFSATLPRGHTYKVTLLAQNEVPMVFPRATGALDTTFMIRSNGAKVSLGQVRYMASAPATGFKVSATAPSGHDDEVEDDDKASCDDGSESKGSKTPEADSPDNRADSAKEMAVAQHNAPNEVDGCDNENESDGEGKD